MNIMATPLRVDDPRNTLERLTKRELVFLAKSEGRRDIDPSMPAELIRMKFRQKLPTRWPRPMRGGLGANKALVIPPYDDWLILAFDMTRTPPENRTEFDEVEEVDHLELLERDYQRQQAQQQEAEREAARKSINEEDNQAKYRKEKRKLLKAQTAALAQNRDPDICDNPRLQDVPSKFKLGKMKKTELARMAHYYGIIILRTDTKNDLIRKLCHAKDTFERRKRDSKKS